MDKIYQKLLVFIAFYSVVSMFFPIFFANPFVFPTCFPRVLPRVSAQGPREGGGQSHRGAGDAARTPHVGARGVAEIGSVEGQGGGGLQGPGTTVGDGFTTEIPGKSMDHGNGVMIG